MEAFTFCFKHKLRHQGVCPRCEREISNAIAQIKDKEIENTLFSNTQTKYRIL